MAESPTAKVKVPPKTQPQQKKKKKKNAPDKPQPAWLFPPDEENPVLNPKPKTDEDIVKETKERDKALDYMKRRVHAAPDRPAPPPQLLTLVGIFLTDFGFNSTSRLFTNERKARQELNGWEDAIGKKIEKGTPKLESIYRDWYREWKGQQKDETSSSESGSETSSESDSGTGLSAEQANQSNSADDSDLDSDDSDLETKKVSKRKKAKNKTKRVPASPSASTTSESDADDEVEKIATPSLVAKKTANTIKQAIGQPTVGAMINSLKRKASSSSSASSESSSSSEEHELPQTKKAKKTSNSTTAAAILPAGPKKVDTKSKSNVKEKSASSSTSSSAPVLKSSQSPKKSTAKVNKASSPASEQVNQTHAVSSSDEPSSSSASDSDSDAPGPSSKSKPTGFIKPTAQAASLAQVPPSDSSATVNGDSKKPSASMSSASDRSSATSSESSDSDSKSAAKASAKKPAIQKSRKKSEGAKQTPLAALSANAAEDSYISNRYQNYDYAEKAYKDLSVTRGKGFTKEKNKKKRGSYRGGAIDTSGGKAFKFED